MPEITPDAGMQGHSFGQLQQEMMVTSNPVPNNPESWVFFPFKDSTHSSSGLLQPRTLQLVLKSSPVINKLVQ